MLEKDNVQAIFRELRTLRVSVNLDECTATIVMPLDLCHRLEKLIAEVTPDA